jgi:hypothetical protein
MTFQAMGLPPGLAIHRDSGLIAGTVAPGASAGSPYRITLLYEGPGRSLSRTFTWHVLPPGPAEAPPAAPREAALTVRAEGLPPGLTLNSSTGIAGAVVSFSWGGADETGGCDSPSQGLAELGDQTHRECDSVELPAGVTRLVYRARGLPPGLTINSSTGLISGTLSFDGGPADTAE